MANYYETLHISPGASLAEIQDAYETRYNYWRRLVIHRDPDVVNKTNQALQQLETIYATLTDPVKRQAYDIQIGLTGSTARLTSPQVPPQSVPSPASSSNDEQQLVTRGVQDNVVVCPECHVENPKSARFCGQCGHTLIEDCPQCHTSVAFYEKFCPACGGNMKELRYRKRVEDAERHRREQEQARLWAERKAREEIQRKRAKALMQGLSVMGGVLGAIAAPLTWAMIWPGVMDTTIGMIAQIIVGAIGGVKANQWLAESVKNWPAGIAYTLGFFTGILAGVFAFPVIVLIVIRASCVKSTHILT